MKYWMLFWILGGGIALAAQEAFAPIAGVFDTLTYKPDAQQLWYLSDPPGEKGGVRREQTATYRFTQTSDIVFQMQLTDVVMVTTLDRHGRLKGWDQRLSGSIRQAVGVDHSWVQVSAGKFRAQTALGPTQKSDDNTSFGPDDLESQTTGQTLQALLQSKKASSFRTTIHTGSIAVEARFDLFHTKDPLSFDPSAAFPASLTSELVKGRSYSLFVMSLEGLASLVYPHKVYFVYDDVRNYALCGYWGGPPDQRQYQVRLFSKEAP